MPTRSSRQPSPDDKQEQRRIETQIRAQRGFTLAGALAGLDGGGHLRGASPIPHQQQAALAVSQWLATNLRDGDGCLRQVIGQILADRPDLLAAHPDRPQDVVAAWLRDLLASSTALSELVREVDALWGRTYQERPVFQQAGDPPRPDDPYTIEDVEARLHELLTRATGR